MALKTSGFLQVLKRSCGWEKYWRMQSERRLGDSQVTESSDLAGLSEDFASILNRMERYWNARIISVCCVVGHRNQPSLVSAEWTHEHHGCQALNGRHLIQSPLSLI